MKITDLPQYSVVSKARTTPKPTEQSSQNTPILQQVGTGAAKELGSTAIGIGSIGRSLQKGVSKGVDVLFGTKNFGLGKEGVLDKGSQAQQTAQEFLQPETGGEKVGSFLTELATFAVPSGAVSKATKGAGVVRNAVGQATVAGGTEIARTGEIDSDAAITAIFGGASVPAGKAFEVASQNLSKSLPEWLVTPLLKQAKDAKIAGKDIAPYLINSGRIGSVDSLVTQTSLQIDEISTKVADSLARSSAAGQSINKSEIVSGVVNKVNQAGGAISEEEVIGIVNQLAPQARGLLQKETLTLVEANQLRSLIDKTLGDRAFTASQLPFNKDVLMAFTNDLREGVKSRGDENIRQLFDDYAKNITLKNALLDRQYSGGGKNSVGLYDLITGAGAFSLTGDPITALAAASGRRVFESAAFKTAAAQVFKNTDQLYQVLENTSPANRAIILQLVAELNQEATSEVDNPQP